MQFPIQAGFKFDGVLTSDHNRQAFDITPDRIENRQRMADGTLRTFFVASKRKIKISWENIPREDNQTVDKFMGAKSLVNFYNSHLGIDFPVEIAYGDATKETIVMMFSDFSYKISARNAYTDMYEVSLGLEEV